ncbi:transcription-associated protein 1, partial [Coemansia thaxteri]
MLKLKTAHPLLALSMETMIDQIVHRLKPSAEEDMLRLVQALLRDALVDLHGHVAQGGGDGRVADAAVATTCRVGLGLPAGAIRARFEADFGAAGSMGLRAYVAALRRWRGMVRAAVRTRAAQQPLSVFSPFLVEFEQQKFEDVEVPGQYLRLAESADAFVRIERFLPELAVDLRSAGVARTLGVRASDGRVARFAVQHFAARHSRHEERWAQLLRNVDAAADAARDPWDQQRLALHLPPIVPLAPHVRLVQELPAVFSLQDVAEDAGVVPEAVADAERLSAGPPGELPANSPAPPSLLASPPVPPSLLATHARRMAPSPMALWLFREHFSHQLAVVSALSYVVGCSQRTPATLCISRPSGSVCLRDLVPAQATPGLLHSRDPVPFRMTPNIQVFVTELGLEGIVP